MSHYLGENRGIIGFSLITRRPGPGGEGKYNTSSWKTINFLFYAVHNIRLPDYVGNWDISGHGIYLVVQDSSDISP